MTIEELHNHLFDVLCIIDDICKKERIRYYLDSGTELGAVRENNFIPWDDDMDIKVLSEDYNSFKNAMTNNLPDYMEFVEPEDIGTAFYDFVVRIIDKRYFIRESTKEDSFYGNYINHVGTDVFILSKTSLNSLGRKRDVFLSKLYYGFAMGHRYCIDYAEYSFVQKLQVYILAHLGRMIPLKKIIKWMKQLTFKYDSDRTYYRLPINYPLKDLKFFPDDLFLETACFPIRGRSFPVPCGYDEELTLLYGNYLIPEKDSHKYKTHLQ